MNVEDPRAHAEGRRTSAVARAAVFGSVLVVSWLFWSSAASADEATPVADDAIVVAPAASEPVTQALTQTVKSVETTVDSIVSPVVGPVVTQVVAPVLDPVVEAVAVPVVETVVDDVVASALAPADILPSSTTEPSAPVGPTVVAPKLPTALAAGLDAAGTAPTGGARQASGGDDATDAVGAVASADTFSGSAALGADAPGQQDLPGPRRAGGTSGATGPSAPASAGARDLPDRTQNVVAHSAAAHAHSAVMALRAPGAPRVAGASVNSGSRPSVTPD